MLVIPNELFSQLSFWCRIFLFSFVLKLSFHVLWNQELSGMLMCFSLKYCSASFGWYYNLAQHCWFWDKISFGQNVHLCQFCWPDQCARLQQMAHNSYVIHFKCLANYYSFVLRISGASTNKNVHVAKSEVLDDEDTWNLTLIGFFWAHLKTGLLYVQIESDVLVYDQTD